MSEDDFLIHGGASDIGDSSADDLYSPPLGDIGNTPRQALSAPRPNKKKRTSFSGDAVNGEGVDLFKLAFRRERID